MNHSRTRTLAATLTASLTAAVTVAATATVLATPSHAATTDHSTQAAASRTTADRATKPTTTALTAKPTAPLLGEKVTLKAPVSGKTTKKTRVTFARQQGDTWTTLGKAPVKRGKAKFVFNAPTESGPATYRASIGTRAKATKNAPLMTITPIGQTIDANLPTGLTKNETTNIAVNLSPGRRDQTVVLETQDNGTWTVIDTATTTLNNNSGNATVSVTPTNGKGTMTLRVTAQSVRGSQATSTPATTATVDNGTNPGGGGGSTGDTTVLTQNASDAVTKYDPATGDITIPDSALPNGLAKGDILVFRPSTAIPGGALRTLTAAPASNGLSTTTASLADAIGDTAGPRTIDFKPIATTDTLRGATITNAPVGAPGDIVGSAITMAVDKYIPDLNFNHYVTGTWSTSLLPRLTLDTTTDGPRGYTLDVDMWEDLNLDHEVEVAVPASGTKAYDQTLGDITRLFQGDITVGDTTIPIYITLTWNPRIQTLGRANEALMKFTTSIDGDPTGTAVRTLRVAADTTTNNPVATSIAFTKAVTGTVNVTSWTGDQGGGVRVNTHTRIDPAIYDLTAGTADLGWQHDLNRQPKTGGGYRCTITSEAAFNETAAWTDLARKVLGFLPGTKAMTLDANTPITSDKNCD